VERSSFVAVKREADRAIPPVGLTMIIVGLLTGALAFFGVMWAWVSDIPDWTYDAVASLTTPLVVLTLVLVYLAGRRRIRRRVLRGYEGDSGYAILADALQRGALMRYNIVMTLLAVLLFLVCQFALSYLNSRLDAEEEEWDEDAQHSAREAALPSGAIGFSPPARSSAPAPA
jgi:heme/copper-type cytochrome/quinol oxidase subunit 1